MPEGTGVNVVPVPVEKGSRRKQAPIPGFGMLKGPNGMLKGPKSKAAAIATARRLRKQVMQRGRP